MGTKTKYNDRPNRVYRNIHDTTRNRGIKSTIKYTLKLHNYA